jgi:long-subunit fatty acid transport protein
MRHFKTGFIASIFSILFISTSFSQELVSPYSAYGIGLVSEKGYVSNNGMGNAGIAYQSPWFIPVLNPALLGSQRFTSFEAGLSISQNNISDEVTRFTQINGGLKYVTIAFPIVPGKYALSVALRPYSSKNYEILRRSSDQIGDPQAEISRFQGEGTISQFSIANGWNITKNIAIGAEANYNFGKITDRTIYQNIINENDTINIPYLVSAEYTDNFSDFSFVFGANFKKKIGENYLSLGATYDLEANIGTTRNSFLQLLSAAETPLRAENDEDAFLESDREGTTVLPEKFSVGLSYMRENAWAILADFTYQDWSAYNSFGVSDNNFGEQMKLNFGGEFTPDVQSGTKYYERITYRAGLNISNGPLVINNTSINSFGITFGSTLPISNISNINLAFEVGQRGTLLNNLVQENYLNFNLSFTFNDRWFLRRQFD